MFETDSLPPEWVDRCNRMDEVWVPTPFHRDTFAAAGVDLAKLFVVGEPVDTDFFNPPPHRVPFNLAASAAGVASVQRPFRFLSVFKWERRKGWDALLEARLLLCMPLHTQNHTQATLLCGSAAS